MGLDTFNMRRPTLKLGTHPIINSRVPFGNRSRCFSTSSSDIPHVSSASASWAAPQGLTLLHCSPL